MIADVVIAAVLLATLAATYVGLATGPGHHKAPMRERRERPALIIHADASQAAEKLEQVQTAIEKLGTAHSPDWAFRPMITEGSQPWPESGTGPVKHAGRPALPPPASKPATQPVTAPSQPIMLRDDREPAPAETGPLSPRRERLHRLHPAAIASLEHAGYDAHDGHVSLIADSCFTRADAAIVAGAVNADG